MYRIACLLLSLLAFPGFALTKVDIFQSEVVLSAEEKAEDLAKAQGLEQVLIKASGQKDVASNPVIEKAMKSTSPYLSQISFGNLDGQETLKVAFNPKQIQGLLTQAGLPYWSESRSSVLVWIVEEDRYERQIIWEQSGSNVTQLLNQFSDSRGLPVTVPVGDFDDVTGISAPEIWGAFVDPISKASQRYPADAVLVLRIQHLSSGRATVRWTLFDQTPSQMIGSQQSPMSGQERGEFSASLQQVVDQVSDYFAGKSAVQVSDVSTENVTVQFLEVKSSRDFFQLESLFKSLNSVASTEVLKIQGSEVTFKVHLLAPVVDFQRELNNFKQVREFSLEVPVESEPVLVESTPVTSDDPQTAEPEVPLETVAEENIPEENIDSSATDVLPEQDEPVAGSDTSESFVEPVEETVEVELEPQEKADLVYEWLG
ncbi:conserved hypothetical protein [Vibrio nigripulchritudo SFn27]|uniref:DUF2066 domain-containing protein n=1 Tax=Vibrio nigripulchritudo TaxID=28173 RepID=U4K792_9VIBR|nr:DUF2066 domain-containing protein [Vibrio nigripulchritudo]CCN84954.1 conserved hypothetical protein [Vibrio nigripulchritudo BLFn1]CCN90166.1 conserved hypothetical protein [Vibrio nigripulchritudo SFn27]CCN94222.1 conserved hypothetical protein [Vibrio nigripulchritudo ENn2]CCO42576.1 conserved hypothetical protein [Vibrio nigripulchritudo SFn135]CCO51321.1 conserved hypothetical protein [Vibrio nigripulchritudo Wn13]